MLAQPISLTSGTTITAFGIDFVSGNTCSSCSLGLYEDSSGSPGDLVGEATGSCTAADGLNELTVSSPFSVPDTGTYWVAHWLSGCNATFPLVRESTTSATTAYRSHTSSSLPDPANTSSSYTDTEFGTYPIGY